MLKERLHVSTNSEVRRRDQSAPEREAQRAKNASRGSRMKRSKERLIVVSNRLPYVFARTEDGWKTEGGSGGLVSALGRVLTDLAAPGRPGDPARARPAGAAHAGARVRIRCAFSPVERASRRV